MDSKPFYLIKLYETDKSAVEYPKYASIQQIFTEHQEATHFTGKSMGLIPRFTTN